VKPLHTIVPTTLAALALTLTACVGAPEGAGDEPAPGPTEEVTGNPTPATESQVPEPTGELGSGEFAPTPRVPPPSPMTSAYPRAAQPRPRSMTTAAKRR
jgi:hypothetical protein